MAQRARRAPPRPLMSALLIFFFPAVCLSGPHSVRGLCAQPSMHPQPGRAEPRGADGLTRGPGLGGGAFRTPPCFNAIKARRNYDPETGRVYQMFLTDYHELESN